MWHRITVMRGARAYAASNVWQTVWAIEDSIGRCHGVERVIVAASGLYRMKDCGEGRKWRDYQVLFPRKGSCRQSNDSSNPMF